METLVVAVRVLISLAVVLGLLWFLHRRLSTGVRSRAASNPITVSGRQNFGQKSSVVVIDLDGQRFLLGVTEHAINVLHTGDIPEQPDAEFAKTLAAATVRPAVRNPLPKGMIGAGSFGTSTLATPHLLSGSVLSLGTWKQAAAVLRRPRRPR